MLRQRDRARRAVDPLLRLQLRGIPRAGQVRAGQRSEPLTAQTAQTALEELRRGGDFKACCTELYGSEAVRWLLGDVLHPGGESLTLRLAELAGVASGERVVDVAAGRGTTARLLARAFDVQVIGVELGGAAVLAAQAEAERAGLSERVRFTCGDAEALPLPGDAFDHVFCECSLCTFPDKPRALAEIARVLKPGGTLALADVTAERDALTEDLRGAMARVACVADARSGAEYGRLLDQAGFAIGCVEEHDGALAAMAERVESRLRVGKMLAVGTPEREGAEEALRLAGLAREAIVRQQLGYSLFVARLS